jgi:hypothetical protein
MREHGTDYTEEVGKQVNVVYSDGTHEIDGLSGRVREVAYQLQTWIENTRAVTGSSSLFDRGKYVSSDNVYEQMRTARSAVKDDDVVSGLAELTEGLAFQGIKWECDDADTMDLFNQMAAEQDLDSVVRKIWREEFGYSQCVLAFWWDYGEFKVRGQTEGGNRRKSKKKVWFPRAITVLDATKIVPVGLLAFGQERLAWQATRQEIGAYNAVALGEFEDELMTRFYSGQYVVRDMDELVELTSLKVDVSRLLLLDDRYVRRHTLTKADYDRFPAVRLKSIFRLLDLKQQLMEADRVSLIGAANYILLVKKGDKDDPAYPEEIDNLKANYKTLAKLPVIFSDHRLTVEIITPKQDYTLNADKYDVLDNRIMARLINTFTAGGTRSGQRSDTQMSLGRPVARAMENRRHMIRRFLEAEIAKAVVEHPRNAGIFTEGPPSLAYSPPNIQLDADAGTAQAILGLRTQKELSRESVLEYFGFDQEVEAMRRTIEGDRFDDVFQTVVPFSSPGQGGPGGEQEGSVPADQAGAGAQGGRPAGGGKPSQNPTKAPTRTARGTTSTGGAK